MDGKDWELVRLALEGIAVLPEDRGRVMRLIEWAARGQFEAERQALPAEAYAKEYDQLAPLDPRD